MDLQDSRFTEQDFPKRVVGMMADYKITLCDAMVWDFESFGHRLDELYVLGGDNLVEVYFERYLYKNGLDSEDVDFYTNIFMGRSSDLMLKEHENNAEGNKK